MEFIMEFFSILVLAVIAMWVGWHLRGIVMLANLSENPDKVIKMLQEIKRINELEKSNGEQQSVSGVELEIERVGSTLYAYTKDTNQFIAQGTDLKGLLAEAHKRFPDKVFFGNIAETNPAKELA